MSGQRNRPASSPLLLPRPASRRFPLPGRDAVSALIPPAEGHNIGESPRTKPDSLALQHPAPHSQPGAVRPSSPGGPTYALHARHNTRSVSGNNKTTAAATVVPASLADPIPPVAPSTPAFLGAARPSDNTAANLALAAMTREPDDSAVAAAAPPLPYKRPVRDANSPSRAMAPRVSTPPPPPPSDRGRLQARQNVDNANVPSAHSGRRDGSLSGIDPDVLTRALSRELSADRRDSAPAASPSRKRQRINGDRFIPSRSGQDLQASFSLLHEEGSPATPSRQKKRTPHGELHFQRSKAP